MSVVGTGTQYLTYTAAIPSTAGPIVGLGWFRIDTDTGAVGIAGGPTDNFNDNALTLQTLASDILRFRYFSNSNANSATSATPGSWFGFAWKWIPPPTTNDGTFDAWVLAEGSAATGFDDQITQVTGLSAPGAAPTGISVLTATTDGDVPSSATVAMFKVFEADLSVAQMLTELQYRNPQQTAWASYVFKTGALTTDDSGNSRTLTNNNTATFSADEPSDILGDNPAAGSALPLVNAMLLS